MKVIEIIEKVSVMYRENLNKLSNMQCELQLIREDFFKFESKGYGNITHTDYLELKSKKERLEREIDLLKKYCRGIDDTRELLFDLDFNAEVEGFEEE